MKVQSQADVVFASPFQHHLFGNPSHWGTDLISRNIQRSRDHGIPDYNTVRQVVTEFFQMHPKVNDAGCWSRQAS